MGVWDYIEILKSSYEILSHMDVFILGCISSRWTPLGAAGFMEPVSRHHPKCTVRNSGEFLGSRIPRPRANLGPGLSSWSQYGAPPV